MASPKERDEIQEKLKEIEKLCPEIISNMDHGSGGPGDLRTREMLLQLYDKVIELEQKGRYYTGSPKLARIM